MMENTIKLSMKETKELLTFAFGLVEGLDQSFADDGKITFGDTPNFLKPLLGIKAAFDDIDLVPVEFENITQQDSVELKQWAKAEFDLEEDKLEAAIEDAITVVLDIWTLYVRYKKPIVSNQDETGNVPGESETTVA